MRIALATVVGQGRRLAHKAANRHFQVQLTEKIIGGINDGDRDSNMTTAPTESNPLDLVHVTGATISNGLCTRILFHEPVGIASTFFIVRPSCV